MLPQDTKTNRADYDALDAVIETFLERQLSKAETISPYYQNLWSEIARLFNSGGKRLRSRMVLLSYGMFGGKDIAGILPIAAAQELLHLGMLIHDDIIDRDYVRYGVGNIAGAYRKMYDDMIHDDSDSIHFANSAALLAGDLMLSEAYLLMAEANVDPKKILEVQKLFGQSVFEAIGGELLDTESPFRKLGSIQAETVALYKTASYSFVMPMLIGASLASVSPKDQNHIRTFGQNLGIAFQLRDDILGVFGDERLMGKTSIGDIREGKKTYLVEQFYQYAIDEQKQEFERYFGNQSITQTDATIARELLVSSGALKKTEQAIAVYELQARKALEKMQLNESYLQQLEDLISIATRRKK